MSRSRNICVDRRVLCQAGALALAGAALPACGGANGTSPPCAPDAGAQTPIRPADVKMNGAQPFIVANGAQVFICQDAHGYYAIDANCTHRGCFVNFVTTSVSFACPCHGATFDFSGGSPTAPAPTPMPHYQLCLDSAGHFVVEVQNVVDPATRLKI